MVDGVDGPMALAAYAAHRGCSKQAVSQAIQSKRLMRSVVRIKGQPKIANIALADQEWESNAGRVTRPVPTTAAAAAAAAPADHGGDETTIQQAIHPGNVISASTLIEAQRLATLERARKLKLENDVSEGSLVEVDAVTKEVFEINRIVRESMMNLPARISGELAAETDASRVHLKLDAAIREALSTTADKLTLAMAVMNA